MTSVPPDDSASIPRTWLVFALGPYLMCASALEVEGIIRCPEAIAKLPLTPDYALGAFLFRGRSAAAISLRRKLRLTQGEDLRTGPFVVTRIGEALVAFWVDEVKDVIEEKDAAWRPMPSMLGGGLFERFAIRGTELVLQTSFAALREAQVEFDSLAAWVAVQAGANHRRPASESLPSAAPELNEERAIPKDSPATAHCQPTLPTPTSVTPELDSPAPRPLPPKAAAARARVAGEQRRDPSRRVSAKAPSMVARAPAPVKTRVDTVAAPEPRSVAAPPLAFHTDPAPVAVAAGPSRGWLAIALGIVVTAIAALLYQFLPAPASDRHERPVASVAVPPSAQGAIAPSEIPATQTSTKQAISIEPDRVAVTIEHGGKAESAVTVVGDDRTAQGSTSAIHTVVRGDTLWQIAKKHVGDPFRYPELAQLSHIRDPNLIRPGDVVRIEIRTQR